MPWNKRYFNLASRATCNLHSFDALVVAMGGRPKVFLTMALNVPPEKWTLAIDKFGGV